MIKNAFVPIRHVRVIIAGGRDFDSYIFLRNRCFEILTGVFHFDIMNNSIIEIIHGNAKGADKYGGIFASHFNLRCTPFPANWDAYGKAAGHIRNSQMAVYATEYNCYGILIAFWDGQSRGTKNMIDCARSRGMDVFVVYYNKNKIIRRNIYARK